MDSGGPPGFQKIQPPGRSRAFYVHKATMKRLYKKTEVAELLRVNNITGVDIEVSIPTFYS